MTTTSSSTSVQTDNVASSAPSACCGRREALRAAGVVAIAGAGLTACGSDAATTVQDAASSASKAASDVATAAGQLAKTADIPVGGGTIIDSAKVVITQPTEGDFKAFSAVCTHQGCTVTSVEGGTINCACHGSKFDIATGEVTQGPATSALPSKSVSVGADGVTVN